MRIEFESCSQNEAFARTVVAAYITRLNPTLRELSDVKRLYQRLLQMQLYTVMSQGREEYL